MKYAKDFRRDARDSLKGKWGIAVLAGFVASILGGIAESAPEINLNADSLNGETNINVFPFINGIAPQAKSLILGIFVCIFIISLVLAVLYFALGAIVEIGYAKFNINIADRKDAGIGNLFEYFQLWKRAVVLRFLIYIFLWSLLFVVPGIVAAYSYAMTSYIMAENPNMTAGEAITESKQMMMGNRGRLFCMQLSFIGWDILSAFTLGIGILWLMPYKQAATAAFYREISGTWGFGGECGAE